MTTDRRQHTVGGIPFLVHPSTATPIAPRAAQTAGQVESPANNERKIWSYEETKSLIAFRCEPETRARFETMKRNKYLWQGVAKKMRDAGHFRSPIQCSVRWKNLMASFKQSYNQVRAHPEGQKRLCSFYRELEQALSPEELRNISGNTHQPSPHEETIPGSVVGLQFHTQPEGPEDDGMSAPIDTMRAQVHDERNPVQSSLVTSRAESMHQRSGLLVTPLPASSSPAAPMGAGSVAESMLMEVVGKLKGELALQRKQFENLERRVEESGAIARKVDDRDMAGPAPALGKRYRSTADGERMVESGEGGSNSFAPSSEGALSDVVMLLHEELLKQRRQFEAFERRSAKLEGLLSLLMEKVDQVSAFMTRGALDSKSDQEATSQ